MPNDYADIYNTFANQRYNSVDRRTLVRAVKPYQKQGISLASATGKTDAEIRAMAVRAVIAKFRADKAKTSGGAKKAAFPRTVKGLRIRRPRRTPAPTIKRPSLNG